ncbi:MAG: type II toxin-antitoxin system Phd/YefM family antitoxin [Candidatus Babeliaceae bacterium]|nr:type II toxin-antitoxin system Phd/YefM family antitoxin [Candidatus Babeliaceae bacterium]
MKVYTYSEARQRFAEVLNIAQKEEVIIKRRGGETFTIIFKKTPKSPFDIPGIKTKATTKNILAAIRDSRERIAEPGTTPDAKKRGTKSDNS